MPKLLKRTVLGQVFGFAVNFFQRLINRHGADRHRRIAGDPFARFVDVFAGGETRWPIITAGIVSNSVSTSTD